MEYLHILLGLCDITPNFRMVVLVNSFLNVLSDTPFSIYFKQILHGDNCCLYDK